MLDIDCPVWDLSKIITWLIIKALKKHGISSISLKFSGNKGFHVGVPFEAFPRKISDNVETKNKFPEAARKISLYLIDFISKNYTRVESEKVIFGDTFKFDINDLSKISGKSIDNLTYLYCRNCKRKIEKKGEGQEEIIVRSGEMGDIYSIDGDFHKKNKMKKGIHKEKPCNCQNATAHVKFFNPLSIIEIDTILISSRHLYRMPYCFNEKSGLISVPINPDKVLDFNKVIAIPENVKVSKFKFLDESNVARGEAKKLIVSSFDYGEKKEEIMVKGGRKYEELKSALPEDFFPPCIKNILKGLEDGRKRSLFILVNFLTSVGWDYDKIEGLLRKWNKKNKEPLREVYLIGQMRYHKTQKKKILPPNCQNKMYYQDLQICKPDKLCEKIRNPVNYSRRKTFYLNKKGKK